MIRIHHSISNGTSLNLKSGDKARKAIEINKFILPYPVLTNGVVFRKYFDKLIAIDVYIKRSWFNSRLLDQQEYSNSSMRSNCKLVFYTGCPGNRKT